MSDSFQIFRGSLCLVGLRQVGKAESAMNALQPMMKARTYRR
jgi:hypothetical protein